ncbi:hypothetical protein PMAYCL1PPCAC_11146, partial [Pristionchus mayeri]
LQRDADDTLHDDIAGEMGDARVQELVRPEAPDVAPQLRHEHERAGHAVSGPVRIGMEASGTVQFDVVRVLLAPVVPEEHEHLEEGGDEDEDGRREAVVRVEVAINLKLLVLGDDSVGERAHHELHPIPLGQRNTHQALKLAEVDDGVAVLVRFLHELLDLRVRHRQRRSLLLQLLIELGDWDRLVPGKQLKLLVGLGADLAVAEDHALGQQLALRVRLGLLRQLLHRVGRAIELTRLGLGRFRRTTLRHGRKRQKWTGERRGRGENWNFSIGKRTWALTQRRVKQNENIFAGEERKGHG